MVRRNHFLFPLVEVAEFLAMESEFSPITKVKKMKVFSQKQTFLRTMARRLLSLLSQIQVLNHLVQSLVLLKAYLISQVTEYLQ